MKRPNEIGLYDMSGNVEEWLNDYYAPYTEDAQVNPQGPATGTNRCVRGGKFQSQLVGLARIPAPFL